MVMSPSVSARLIPVSMVPPVTLVDDSVVYYRLGRLIP